MDGLNMLDAWDVLGRMDLGKHPAYDSIRPYNPGDIVSYGGDVWQCVSPVYPVVFGPAKSAEAKEWRAKGDGIVHAPSNSDSHWKNISDRNESDFTAASLSETSWALPTKTNTKQLSTILVGIGAAFAGVIFVIIVGRK